MNTILRRTAGQKKDPEKSVVNPYSDENFSADTASKIILTGHAVSTTYMSKNKYNNKY